MSQTSSSPPAPAGSATPPRRPGVILAVAAAGIVAAVAAVALTLARPVVVFTNRLAGPVRLEVNRAARLVAPGETVRARVARDLVVVQWELVRPRSADDRPMGEEVRGSWVVRSPRGEIARAASARTDTGDYFAPLVTNATAGLLRITVNAGLEGALDCGCAVRPGARRVFIGYYRLYRNSSVQATDPRGRTATFRELGPEAEARSWTVGLRFAPEDFPS
jgi:hypothetical protein